jgi:hypothetical protein
MLRNIKYESFGVGRAGQGRVNLHTGNIEFVHNDTNSDSNMIPMGISHVYSTVNAEDHERPLVCGKGFGLNIHQRLRKVSEDPNDTRHILTDAAGKEHEFKEMYYYRNSEGERAFHRTVNEGSDGEDKVYLTPEDIMIGLDGRLTYEEENGKIHDIFVEQRTDSGSILRTGPAGFIGIERIETRHEDMIALEENIDDLERIIEDLNFMIDEYGRFTPEYDELMSKQHELDNYALRLDEYIFEIQSSKESILAENSDGRANREELLELRRKLHS